MKAERKKEFHRNEELETLLQELNSLLEPVEKQILEKYRIPRYTVVLVVGVPRCGSTLVMQWLAQTGKFAYPTNLLSRFYGTPYVGARIQQLLTDPTYSFRNELMEFVGEFSFESDLGKTRGTLAPNEFWYFWRRFIPNTEPRFLDQAELQKIKVADFVAELAALEAAFDKPWAMKALILELNIPFLSAILDKVLFLHIKRHPFYNIQSLLGARVRYFGDRRSWYSIKPREYEMLQGLDPVEQVAGQVYFTNHNIEEGLDQVADLRKLVVDYEAFCANPGRVFDQIVEKFRQQGFHTAWKYAGPGQFRSTNQVRVSEEDCKRILKAYKSFSGVGLSL